MGFLLSRRWLMFAVLVAAGAYGASLLGQWQFHRLDERRQDNRIVARNLDLASVPVSQVLDVGKAVPRQQEWRRITAHGVWDDEHTIVLKYQTREGTGGVDVLTPLVTDSGVALIVDRGWLAWDSSARPKTPPTTSGAVTVTGWVRLNATGSATAVNDMTTRAISSKAIANVVPHPVYDGFVDLAEETPEPSSSLAAAELPDDTSEGPHFFYGLQWWFFGALAIFGFGYLAYDERRHPRSSESAEHASVDGEHRPSDE